MNHKEHIDHYNTKIIVKNCHSSCIYLQVTHGTLDFLTHFSDRRTDAAGCHITFLAAVIIVYCAVQKLLKLKAFAIKRFAIAKSNYWLEGAGVMCNCFERAGV